LIFPLPLIQCNDLYLEFYYNPYSANGVQEQVFVLTEWTVIGKSGWWKTVTTRSTTLLEKTVSSVTFHGQGIDFILRCHQKKTSDFNSFSALQTKIKRLSTTIVTLHFQMAIQRRVQTLMRSWKINLKQKVVKQNIKYLFKITTLYIFSTWFQINSILWLWPHSQSFWQW